MATRIYFPSNIASPISPSYDAEWDRTSDAARLLCVPAKQATAFGQAGPWNYYTPTPPYDVLCKQFVSPPLLAQTISGTVKGQFRVKQRDITDDFCRAVVIKVVSADGGTVRGTLLSHFPGALTSEFATAYTNRNFPPSSALTDVVCQLGDRIVIELGFRTFASVATYLQGIIEVGDNSSSDLPEDETTTGQYCPWIEFSGNIQWDKWIQADAVGSTAAYGLAPCIQANSLGAVVAYSLTPDPWILATAHGALVAYRTIPDPVIGGRRIFPVPDPRCTWQSQAGKRKFPLPPDYT